MARRGSKQDRTLAELADFARLVVRSGYLNRAHVLAEVGNFVRAEVDSEAEATALTDRLVGEAEAELAREQAGWPLHTDNDALADALGALATAGYLVIEYATDHTQATAALKAYPGSRGVVFFTETDVWHAITDRMLEIKMWHADTANVVAGDPELAEVMAAVRDAGLPVVFDEGRIEVTMTWRRRPVLDLA